MKPVVNGIESRKNAIQKLIEQALYCLNLQNEQEKKQLEYFLNSFLAMQGPEFFSQLNDIEIGKAYAGGMCDLWHFFQRQDLQSKVALSFFDHPYQENQFFLSILSKDCSYILKTIKHILAKQNIKYKNMMHPVLHTQRDEHGRFIKFIDHLDKKNIQCADESVIHFLVVSPLDTVEREFLRLTLEQAFIELYKIDNDFQNIQKKVDEIQSEINFSSEEAHFIRWIKEDRYYFYGYRYLIKDAKQDLFYNDDTEENLGLLNLDTLKYDSYLTPACSLDKELPLVRIYKSSLRSNINRGSRYDCIEISRLDENKNIIGFHQIIGVFAPDFFESVPLQAPLARIRAQQIFDSFKFNPTWYNGKLLSAIMNSISLDLFFQLDNADISDICQRVLEIQNDVMAFIKPNQHDDYVLILLFMPFEKYSFTLKNKIKAYLENMFKGNIYSEHVLVGEYPFARLLFVIDRKKEIPIFYDLLTVQKDLSELATTWSEKLERLTDYNTSNLIARVFPDIYKDDFDPEIALLDIEDYKRINAEKPFIFNFYEQEDVSRIHFFNNQSFITFSSILAILERFGFNIISENSYELIDPTKNTKVYLQIFYVTPSKQKIFDIDDSLKKRFLDVLSLVWKKEIKDDYLNSFVIINGFDFKELMLLRLYIKALCQIGIPYSYDHIVDVLFAHPVFVKQLIVYFDQKFNINLNQERNFHKIYTDLLLYCDRVNKIDEDRILRRLLNLFDCSLRTNFYQKTQDGKDKNYISVKFKCSRILELPSPKPLYEIFVYAHHVQGIHLRTGKVSRGGIRWSDRIEDFRSEILGLVKAQTVKNSVIVPLGAKGGFIVHGYDQAKTEKVDNQTLKTMVVDAYKTYIMGLLDITDNIIDNEIKKPIACVCYDDNDPYLVVAADKGTATFSDIANELSHQYNFWLGDAFASGGSKGYDHKKMGITAKGAWVSTQRHFLEKGIDVQKDPITVIGVGDMSGDVFGNGMLLSDKIKLIAAFNHEHIFIDPNPDPKKSFEERKRLFKLSGSKWTDYDRNLLSEGGMIVSRGEKQIELSVSVCSQLNIDLQKTIVTSDELISCILKASADLIFFGGIGTFIKAESESHFDVKDKANDLVRINGKDVRAKVIVEGANLGVTQKGRIEYALSGGRINMDAVDNSAGVDCSDHEVNIKIFFNYLIQKNVINLAKRNQMLLQMTDAITQHILLDNFQQNFLLSVLEQKSFNNVGRYLALIGLMSKNKYLTLDPQVEYLPSAQELEMRKNHKIGFTRPELSILISYAKLHLYQELLLSLDDKQYESFFFSYFPDLILQNFKDELTNHPLKKEIIATVISNFVINHLGISFVYDISIALHVSQSIVIDVFLKIVDLLNLQDLWQAVAKTEKNNLHKQYEDWHAIQKTIKSILFVCLKDLSFLRKINKDNFQKIFSIYLSSLSNRKNSIDENIDVIENCRYIPFFFEFYKKNIDKTDEQLEQLSQKIHKISILFDYDFLFLLTEQNYYQKEWEIITHQFLIDDLYEKMSDVINSIFQCGKISHFVEQNHEKIEAYDYHKNLAKTAFESHDSCIGIMTYMIKNLERFLSK
jgi:glutamate dehydrogenase